MKKPTSEKIRRRAFLKGAAVAGTALGVATTRTLADVSADSEATEKPAAATGYRETGHIRAYYRLARL